MTDLYLCEQEHKVTLFVPLSHTDMKVSRVSGEDVHFIDRQGSMNISAVQGPTKHAFPARHIIMLLPCMMETGG